MIAYVKRQTKYIVGLFLTLNLLNTPLERVREESAVVFMRPSFWPQKTGRCQLIDLLTFVLLRIMLPIWSSAGFIVYSLQACITLIFLVIFLNGWKSMMNKGNNRHFQLMNVNLFSHLMIKSRQRCIQSKLYYYNHH